MAAIEIDEAALTKGQARKRAALVCREKAPSHSGCKSRPATVVPAGSNRSE